MHPTSAPQPSVFSTPRFARKPGRLQGAVFAPLIWSFENLGFDLVLLKLSGFFLSPGVLAGADRSHPIILDHAYLSGIVVLRCRFAGF